mmetsp:Transcript_7048/g.8084  ORF Transcript_7048/g.8084 Transcript_7048/m.8084 type:complete len:740 (-) Transcript_7048:351-2570(-)|eukprot:CAMPEP_0197859406 /NCGR_PEP_ID=MMETSP1438-20131217/33919_1 /TAXON_ID=1461541 /ORGANISM="Pterosperma sp., Strain CCMP1384" /LENGTH=739 /DNA_ID=CAMNT_0043475875 /DNA_START=194 /DNA_END=2413 /DNA_ORIENTATION=-
MLSRLSFVALLVLFSAASSAALLDLETDDPKGLLTAFEQKSEFRKTVVEDRHNVWAILFYEDTGASEGLVKEFIKAAEQSTDIVKFGLIEVTSEKGLVLAKQLGLMGQPVIKVYAADRTYNPYTHEWTKDVIAETGGTFKFEAKKIASFVTHKMTSKVTKLAAADETYNAHVTSLEQTPPTIPSIYLVSKKKEVPALFSAMSLKYQLRANLYFISSEDKEIADGLGVESFPGLVVRKADGSTVAFDDKLSAETLIPFLDEHAGPHVELPEEEIPKKEDKKDDKKKPGKKIKNLDVANFEEKVIEEEKAVIVAFYGGEKCNAQLEEAATALSSIEGLLLTYQVDVTAGDAQAKMAKLHDAKAVVDGEACVVLSLFPFGFEKEQGEAFKGSLAAPREIQDFVYDAFPQFVETLMHDNFQNWLAQGDRFGPKILFFSKKDDPSPMMHAVAANFMRINVGFVSHFNDELVQQFQVKKFPSIMCLFFDKTDPSGQKIQLIPYPQQSKMDVKGIHQFFMEINGHFYREAEDKEENEQAKEEMFERAPEGVHEVSTNAEFSKLCSSLCIINFVDGSDVEALEKQKAIMLKAKENESANNFAFLWVDATRQPEFAANFEIDAQSVPEAVMYSAPKMRWAKGKGAYKAETLVELVVGVTQGRFGTYKIQDPPVLVDGGVDPPPPEEIVEEEFDLSDIMGEEVEVTDREAILKQAEEEAAAAKEKAAKGSSKKSKKKKGKKKKSEKGEL